MTESVLSFLAGVLVCWCAGSLVLFVQAPPKSLEVKEILQDPQRVDAQIELI